MAFRKSISEEEILALLQNGQLQLPPLKVSDVQSRPRLPEKKAELDAIATLEWGNKAFRFAVEVKGLWTPKAVELAVDKARKCGEIVGAYPLIIVPYLNKERLLMLESLGVSGIDLCGNGVVVVPEQLLILRTGFPNRFRREGAIKNVYRKNSSVAARVFLLVTRFDSLNAATDEIRRRDGDVTTATVSKVFRSLEDDLVIKRGRGRTSTTSLLQPEKLLDLLANNYAPPEVNRTFSGKYELPPEALRERLAKAESEGGSRIILTGASSVDAYAVMAREPVQSFYCTDIEKVMTSLDGDLRETERFANVTFQETRDDFVYFDRRPGLLASPIQTYLELAKGDKREQETAEQVRRVVLGRTAP